MVLSYDLSFARLESVDSAARCPKGRHAGFVTNRVEGFVFVKGSIHET